MFCSLLLVVVIHAGCDKQDSLIRGVCAVNCTVDRRSCCSHFTSHRSDSQIFVDNCDICLPRPPAFDAPPFLRGPRRNIAITFGKEKLEWCGWLPDDEKISKICLFVLTESTNVTDRDGRTDTAAWQHSITRQKNNRADFAANWRKWSTRQRDETINFRRRKVKDQRHTTTPNLDLEAWRRHPSRPLRSSRFSSFQVIFIFIHHQHCRKIRIKNTIIGLGFSVFNTNLLLPLV